MRLNVGCGGRRIEGYIGVDAVERSAADLVAPADSIPLEDGSVDEIMAIHLVEHILPWGLPGTLAEWARLLRPGGNLFLEMPDVMKCCENIVTGRSSPKHPDQLGMWGLFGDSRLKDPYMLHRWAYCFATLEPLVKDAGFVKIKEARTKFHPVGMEHRDFRLEATR